VYQPIAKSSVNAPAGLVIDLVYGFVITGIFILLFKSLPGSTGLMRGVSFAVLVWFLRVVMGVVGGWMTLNVPAKLHVYELLTGLGEMGILGVFLGIAFRGKIGVSG